LVEYIETKVDKKYEEKKDTLATKEDLLNVKSGLEVKIEQVRSDIIKWMFLFWIGQVATLFALLQLFFRK